MVFIGALSAVLYHYRVLPWVVRGFAWALSKTLGISGAASFSTAANVFIGMVEAPLLVRPYIERMSRSELFIIMVGGMATIAGTVFALYSTMLRDIIPDPAGHLLTASIISAPAAVVIALILIPSSGDESEEVEVEFDRIYENGADALTSGAIEGLRLFAYIIGMLIVLIALVELVNIILEIAPAIAGEPLTLQRILGWVLAPAVWTLGVPWSESVSAGQLLGTKVVLNELVAYIQMSQLSPGHPQRARRTDNGVQHLRLRQLRQSGNNDRRNRSHSSEPQTRNRATRPQVHSGRHHGHLHDGRNRRHYLLLLAPEPCE